MAIVDAEGRLFGRWNFIDAVVALLVLGLIPIGYAAYALFRTPLPVITSIEPAEVVEGPNQRITVRGANLRPYLRVSFNTMQGATFLFEDATKAVVDLHPMAPGTYDVILYDLNQERHRLPGALTVRPAGVAHENEVMVSGRFINLTPAVAALIKPGAPVSISGQIVETAAPRTSVPRVYASGTPIELPTPPQLEVPAVIKMGCVIKVTQGFPECGGAEFALRPHYVFQSTLPGDVPAPFQIDQIYGMTPVKSIRATVRFVGAAEALNAMRVGDLDVDLTRNPLSLGARVASLGPVSASANEAQRSGVLEVRAQQLPSGWWFGGVDSLRVSGQLTFRTARYTVTATVGSVTND
ncbi:MAG: IPT/TIG domain-containing protein [Vicinamibacterales bacterium]